MSNKVNLTRTKFTDLKSGDESFGYRIYDDYGSGYAMFSDGKIPDDDGVFLKTVVDGCDQSVNELIDWAIEHGMIIDDHWYNGKEIENMLNCSEEKTV